MLTKPASTGIQTPGSTQGPWFRPLLQHRRHMLSSCVASPTLWAHRRYCSRNPHKAHNACPDLWCKKPDQSSSTTKTNAAFTAVAEAPMSGLLSLAGTSALMFLGSYAAGLLPLAARTNNAGTMQMINAVGAGLLLGAALCVVLPEGFVTFLEAQENLDADRHYPEWVLGLSLLLGFLTMTGLQAVAEQWETQEVTAPSQVLSSSEAPGTYTGAAPAFGSTPQRTDEPGDEQVLLLGAGVVERRPPGAGVGTLDVSSKLPRTNSALSAADQALLGLVIHSAADGIAVGAACLSDSLALTTSIAAAILIHKFPVAFGLSSFLRGAGWRGPRLQKGLLLFCSAAPLAAIAMYGVFGRVAAVTDQRTVAACLLFSGGTVLHAGLMHVLPSVLGSSSEPHGGHMHGGDEGHARAHVPSMHAKPVVLAVVAGASLVPLIISALLPES